MCESPNADASGRRESDQRQRRDKVRSGERRSRNPTRDDDLPSPDERIWQVIASIPHGQVASYGQVAELAELPRGARRVGRALKNLPAGTKLPWYRVINAAGGISLPEPGASRQRARLRAEGIVFVHGKVNLKRFRWQP